MRLSEGIEWSVHCCSILASLPEGAALSARDLAEYFDLPAAYLAKSLQHLSAAGLVSSRRGRNGGYALARPAADITLLGIVEAVEGRESSFRCTEIRRRGPCGVGDANYARPCGIARAMWRADAAWRDELSQVSLADIARSGLEEMPPRQLERSLVWFEEKLN
ncbi:MAG: Rrf2 family transcriptional regulator [Halioglobus sp.]|nr:Rrf2 family transcriptional regulator [Halioglobus sp.]